MIVQSKHWGKTIRGWTEEMGDTRQSSWIKQGGMWITKWERIILEIWQFLILKKGKKPKAGVIIKKLCSLFCSHHPWHLSAWQEKGAWRSSAEALLRAWVVGHRQPYCSCHQEAVTRHWGAAGACSASPGAPLGPPQLWEVLPVLSTSFGCQLPSSQLAGEVTVTFTAGSIKE